jgi:hypothetical protein
LTKPPADLHRGKVWVAIFVASGEDQADKHAKDSRHDGFFFLDPLRTDWVVNEPGAIHFRSLSAIFGEAGILMIFTLFDEDLIAAHESKTPSDTVVLINHAVRPAGNQAHRPGGEARTAFF